jgi:GntR family transcriptional regulator, phosphonate transport system regulatory protein
MGFTSGVTRWRQIAQRLSQEVSAGIFADGRLPTEMSLAARFQVNRHTIRRAVAALEGQGVVRVEQGRGTFVTREIAAYLSGLRPRFTVNPLLARDELCYRLIRVSSQPADAATAQKLGLLSAAPIVEIEALGELDGVPIAIDIHRFPAERFASPTTDLPAPPSFTAALGACDTAECAVGATGLLARMPSDLEARRLDQPLSRPVLQAERVGTDLRGAPVRLTTSIYSADRVQVALGTS